MVHRTGSKVVVLKRFVTLKKDNLVALGIAHEIPVPGTDGAVAFAKGGPLEWNMVNLVFNSATMAVAIIPDLICCGLGFVHDA